MNISEIKKFPVRYIDKTNGETHESMLRSYQVLQKVKQMLSRGDSQDTILEVIELCYSND